MWHRQGKVNLTKGSDVVTGVGTNWVENIRVGDAFQGPDGKLYQVINVASNEALAISPAYEGNTAANLNYWIVPVPGYSKTQADRLSLIISKLDGDIVTATEAADRAQAAAQQAQQWGNEAAASAAATLQSEQSAALSADIAEQARDDAVAVVTGGTASIDPEAGKIPIAGAEASIKQAWIENLQFELDALRVAKNRILYGDGPYPVLDFQFAGAKYLDPRIQFTRASLDWDENGKEYGIDEPVLTDKGWQTNKTRTNLQIYSNDLMQSTGWTNLQNGTIAQSPHKILSGLVSLFNLDPLSVGTHMILDGHGFSLLENRDYVLSLFVKRTQGARVTIRLRDLTGGVGDAATVDFDTLTISGAAVGGLVPVEGDVYRFWAVVNSKQGSGSPRFRVSILSSEEGPVPVGGANIVEGTTLTSYIPTEGSQVTVAPSFQGIYRRFQQGFTLYLDFTIQSLDSTSTVTGFLGLGNYAVGDQLLSLTGFAKNLRLTFYGATGNSSYTLFEIEPGTRVRLAIVFNISSVTVWRNGTKILEEENLRGIVNNFDQMEIGAHRANRTDAKSGNNFIGLTVFDKILTANQLQELTS